MSIVNPFPRQEVITAETSSLLFEAHPEAAFWVGQIAANGEVSHQELYDAAAQMRGKIYTELGFLALDRLDEFGRESDADDQRSIHFGVAENIAPGNVRLPGTGRFVIKRGASDRLPIESHFPEVFAGQPATTQSVELSRLIARHPDKRTQHGISLSTMRAMTYYAIKEGIEHCYFMVEKPLARMIGRMGWPLEAIGEAREVKELGGVLYPTYLDCRKVEDLVMNPHRESTPLREFLRDGLSNDGEGYYSTTFTPL